VTTFEIQDFRAGLDTRRNIVKGAPGSLRVLRNAHITRGGEIEKRKAFSPFCELPGSTFGLAAVNGQKYVFGSAASMSVPPGVAYQRLPAPAGRTMTGVLSVALSAGKLFVIAAYDDGSTRQFYDGAQVTNYSINPDIQNARIALAYKNQMTLLSGNVLARSKIADPVGFNIGDTGAAFYDLSTQTNGSEALTGVAEYQQNLAVFSRRTIQVWAFSADPAAAAKAQTLTRIGTTSPRSVVSVGGADVFFLADSGVRSLRVRDSNGNAAVQDVGTPIDDTLVSLLRTMTPAQFEGVFAELEPGSGRYWITLAGATFVYSGFPSAGITAWSTYDLPPGATDMVVVDDRVFVRAGDAIYLYGGADNNQYDATPAEVEIPYVDGRGITTWKQWQGIDIAAEGTWQVYASYNPLQPDREDLLATLTGSSFFDLDHAVAGIGPFVKLRLVSVGSGPAKLASIALRYVAASMGR